MRHSVTGWTERRLRPLVHRGRRPVARRGPRARPGCAAGATAAAAAAAAAAATVQPPVRVAGIAAPEQAQELEPLQPLLPAMPLPQPIELEESTRWSRTLERISTGVVAITIDAARAFDTEWNTSSQATGFIVDAERGLILTNRHVVTPGPVRAFATFLNREEVALEPVYRDPVHDFGFYRYDPVEAALHPAGRAAAVSGGRADRRRDPRGRQRRRRAALDPRRYARAPRPPGARVRRRPLQRLQYLLLAGRLGHLRRFLGLAGDRHPRPRAGAERRWIDRRGVQLLPAAHAHRARTEAGPGRQAGPARHAADHLQLHALRRAAPPRAAAGGRAGSAQGRAGPHRHAGRHRGPARRRRGRSARRSATCWSRSTASRWPTSTRSTPCSTTASASQIEVAVVRGGGTRKVTLPVQDLHEITPDEYLEIGDGVLHTLSWQMARHMNVPISGVYVANPGYMLGVAGIPRGAVLTELDGKPLRNLDDALAIFAGLGHGQRATLRYFTMEDTRTLQLTSIRDRPRMVPGSALRARRRDRSLALHADRDRPGRAATAARHDALHAHRRQARGRVGAVARAGRIQHAVLRFRASPSATTTAPASCSTRCAGWSPSTATRCRSRSATCA